MKKLIRFTILGLLFYVGAFAQNDSNAVTNTLGIAFQRIESGSMIVGKIDIECPEFPDTRNVPEEQRWTETDFKKCREIAERDSRPGFLVNIEKPFYLGKYEITQSQWKAVMGDNPSFFQGDKVVGDGALHPVENVTWEMVQKFLARLNAMEPNVTYRLPTEFEWEYAARAGNDSLLSWAATRQQAWIQQTDKGTTKEVGTKKSNAWGLYDMLGNVWEWVDDFHNEDVFPGPVPPEEGSVHVLRGGSFISDVTNATYIFHGGGPGNGYDVGFRIVMEIK